MTFKAQYGPWAVLVGGSEGIGEHLSRKLGRLGLNLVLVARKAEPLAQTAEIVRRESGAEVRTLQLDITRDDMLERIRDVTDGLEIGLLVHNVGGGGGFGAFVDLPLEDVLTPLRANPVAVTKLVHHFGKKMADRGRGGILFIGSLAGNAGNYNLAAYSAAKAFIQILAEALWAELEPRGVHVLAIPIGAADTPSRARSGVVDDEAMPVASCERVAQEALDQLPHGPVYVLAESRDYFNALYAMSRRDAASLQRQLMTKMLPAKD